MGYKRELADLKVRRRRAWARSDDVGLAACDGLIAALKARHRAGKLGARCARVDARRATVRPLSSYGVREYRALYANWPANQGDWDALYQVMERASRWERDAASRAFNAAVAGLPRNPAFERQYRRFERQYGRSPLAMW